MIPRTSCCLRRIRLFNELIKLVRCYPASNPETDTDRFLSKTRICLASDHFRRYNHFRDTVTLLRSKEAQCVPEHNRDATIQVVFTTVSCPEPSVSYGKSYKSKICFCFTATGREIEKIDNFPIFMCRVNNPCQVHQNKSNLEWPPAKIIVRVLRIDKILKTALDAGPVFLCIVLYAVLKKDNTVHEAECFK